MIKKPILADSHITEPPHSTWPRSQEILDEHAGSLSEQERNWICDDNVAELHGLNPPS